MVRQPLLATETADKFDILITAAGGGPNGPGRRGAAGHRARAAGVQCRAAAQVEGARTADARRSRNTSARSTDRRARASASSSPSASAAFRSRARSRKRGFAAALRCNLNAIQAHANSALGRVRAGLVRTQTQNKEAFCHQFRMKELLEAGVHFGHQTKRWNPKMKEYIFGERNGIYIIDLQKTLKLFKDAMRYVGEMAAQGKTVLFVGTKRQAQEAIAEEATRCARYST